MVSNKHMPNHKDRKPCKDKGSYLRAKKKVEETLSGHVHTAKEGGPYKRFKGGASQSKH